MSRPTLNRTHISYKPIDRLRAVDPQEQDGAYKPRGFWYEVDGDWRRWCESEMPQWLKGKKLYRLDLDGENVLRIANVVEFDAFHREYCKREVTKYDMAPDWRALSDEYDGIEIAPYLWERRLTGHTMWYYGWDCASGVLWRPKGARVVLLGEVEVPA